MPGLGNFFAIVELRAGLERTCADIHRELERIGCANLEWIEDGGLLGFSSEEETCLVEPEALLELLRGVPAGTPEHLLRRQILARLPADRTPRRLHPAGLVALCALLAATLSLVIYLVVRG